MISTLHAFHTQVSRLARGDTAVDATLPGPLGETVRESVARLTEVTQRLHLSEAAAVNQARTDALTGLGNRAAVLERLERLVDTEAASSPLGAIVFLDLDGFKSVNDSQGHAAGDRILREIGERLQEHCPGDLVARMGGDEFIVLIDHPQGLDRVRALALSLIRVVSEPCAARDGQQFILSASAGVTTVNAGDDPLECIARADSAVYRAKELGRSRVEVFDESLAAEIEARSEMSLKMRQGLSNGEFHLELQPIVNLSSGRAVAVEALLRWRLADGRVINPGDFIPIAERTGVVLAIDEWVINAAVQVARDWQQDPVLRDLRVTVNISGRHVVDGTLTAHLQAACARHGVSADRLGVEITETYLMADPPRAKVAVEELRALGITVSIDDFGTGYSSMSALHHLRPDILKLDQVFVGGVARSEVDRTIVELVLRLAESLGIPVVAEGVDSDEKLHQLKRMGCAMAQGFHLAQPMTIHHAAAWLRDRAGDRVSAG